MLYIKDPLCFKESILISLEALSDANYDLLKEFVQTIDNSAGVVKLDTTVEVEESLSRCIKEFKEKKTYFWLREDFKNSLYDTELQVNKNIVS